MASGSGATASININTTQALQSLDALEQRIRRVRSQLNGLGGGGGGGGGGLGNISARAMALGAALGGVTIALTSVVNGFMEVGKAGMSALGGLISESVELNTMMETYEIKFARIFEQKGMGKEEAGVAAAEFAKKISQDAATLGQDPAEMMKAMAGLIPDFANYEEMEKALPLIDALADETGRGLDNIRIAFERATSMSEMSSALDRVDQEAMKSRIQEMVDGGEEPLTAFIDVLHDRMIETGAMMENASEGTQTFEKQLSTAKNAVTELKLAFGEDIFEAYSTSLGLVTEATGKHREDLMVLVLQAGEIIGQLANFFGVVLSGAINSVELKRLQEMLLYINNSISAVRLLGEVFIVTSGGIEESTSYLDTFIYYAKLISPAFAALTRVQEDLEKVARLLAYGKAFSEGLKASLQPIAQMMEHIGAAFVAFIGGDIVEATKHMEAAQNQYNTQLIDMEAGQQAVTDSLAKTNKKFDEHEQRVEDNTEAVEEYREKAQKTEIKEDLFKDSIGKGESGEKDTGPSEEEYLEASEKYSDALEKIETDRSRKLEDIARGHGDKLVDIEEDIAQKRLDVQQKIDQKFLEQEIDNAREREDIARENAKAVEDINRSYLDSVEDAAIQHSRDTKNMARKQANDRVKLETDIANKRVDIERNYRQRLQQIQMQFNQSADDAIRNRDAVAYVNAQRKMKQDVQSAELERSQSVEDANIEAQRQREALRQQQAIEREEAQIAYGQKMEDLQLQNERELEEQRIKHQREIEEQGVKEQRKAEDLAMWEEQERNKLVEWEAKKRQDVTDSHQKQLEDAQLWYKRKYEDLQASLEEELALIEEYEAKKQEAMAETQQTAIGMPHPGLYPGRNRPMGMPHPGLFPGRASGGPVTGGYPYMVGERGPELFIPPSVGRIMNNRKMMSTFPMFNSATGGQSNDNRQFDVSIPNDQFTPTQQAQIQNLIINAVKM